MTDKDQNTPAHKEHWIIKNIAGAVLLFLVLWIVSSIVLNVITNHGKSIDVPDLTNMDFSQARREAHNHGLGVEIVDSIFIKRMERGAVYSQNPKAGSQVKKGRVINLTINAMNPKLVSMPNLVGYSMRQAKAELNSRGLALGRLIYVDDIATNNVLRQLYNNRQVKPGRKIESGSEIDLEVGLNPESNQTVIPDLTSRKYLRAVDEIHENSLNVGKLVFDSSVKSYADSLDAQVYRQSPEKSDEAVLMGTKVNIYLSIDPNKTILKEKQDKEGKK